MERELRAAAFVRDASANPVTGRVLIHVDRAAPAGAVERVLLAAIERALAAADGTVSEERAPRAARERLLADLGPDRDALAIATRDTVLAFVASLSRFALVRAAIDLVVGGEATVLGVIRLTANPWGFAFVILGGLALTVVQSALDYRGRMRWRRVALGYEDRLRRDAFAHVAKLDLRYFERANAGRIVTALGADVGGVGTLFGAGYELVRIGASSAVVACALAVTAPQAALWALLPIPVVIWAIRALQGALKPRLAASGAIQGRVNARIAADVDGIATIKAFSAEEREGAAVARDSAELRRAKLESAEVALAFAPTLELIVMGGTLTTLVATRGMVDSGRLSPGAFASMMMMTGQLLYPLMGLGGELERLENGIAAVGRVYELLDTPVADESGDRALDPATLRGEIVFDRVRFGYDAQRHVLDDLSMRIPAGGTVAIVGPTGSGKTTLIKLLMRFYAGYAGTIAIDGMEIANVRIGDLRGAIGLVSQEPYLFAGTIRENILLGRPDADDAAMRAAARIAQAATFIEELPGGYETPVGERGVTLSGGQRQRISIARALVREPHVLILDEATSAVDNETEARFFRDLRAANARTTTIIVAHRLSTIRNADRIFVVRDGRIAEEGTHEELTARDGMYASALRFGTLGMDAFGAAP